MTVASSPGAVWAVIPTYRRTQGLTATLDVLASQTKRPDAVIVVDNGSSADVAQLVEHFAERVPDVAVSYVDPGANTGPAGAMFVAMERAVAGGNPNDWLLRLDDDRPLRSQTQLEELIDLCAEAMAKHPRVAAVGCAGSRYDWRTGRLVRPLQDPDGGLVEVDFLSTNHFPLFKLEAIRAVGPFDAELFFGSSELEYCLRLRRAGFVLYRTDRWTDHRPESVASRALPPSDWRRYYSLRNQIALLRRFGHSRTAVRVALIRGVGKPLANVPMRPRRAMRALSENLRAIRDGWSGRLGRTVDPDDWMGDVDEVPHT